MKVRWSEQAAMELADTAAYVACNFGKRPAVRLRDTIHDAVSGIAQFPMMEWPVLPMR